MADARFTFTHDVRPVCEIGMSATRLAEPTSWLDVSCFVHEAELFRGRERFNERFEPGTASVTFTNDDGWADLGGTYTEVAAAELRPGRQIRIGVHGPWNPGMAPFVRWLYRGFIDQATPNYDPTQHDTVTVNCIDALGEAGSSTAPTGEHQGVNETAAERINRVLDAVGWWSSKRKIDATTTTVQGTSLGGSGIDHMGQAADSAGGVVFGDLDGDVVFRDIDWMLYDPDDPPDGEIGPGDPGAPPGGGPPYIDPAPGPVYDPDDPPSPTPPRVCVCADGTAGTLIEKGDNYRLYVKDGHLFYESSGHTWDLGPYSGGCTCVDPPTEDDPPVRDDPGPIAPFPGIPVDPVFAVELLAWDDANRDEVIAAVTVGGVHPGHDCLLVVMVNALADTTNTTALAPVVTGGDLEWVHRRDVDRAAVVTATIAVAAVGRDDPGTFDVVATWAAGQTSFSHIVTVWKVTAAANDYLERFDAGAILYALTASNPPDTIWPGDGPVTFPLAADRQPAGVPATTRTFDITIAQSLADDEHGPFGAEFDDTDGVWIVPPLTSSGGPVVLLDDFERADGAIGSNWVVAKTPGPVWNPTTGMVPLTIASGAAVGALGAPTPTSSMYWHEAQGANQSIEVELDPAIWAIDGYCQLFTNANAVDPACQFSEWSVDDGDSEVTVYLYHVNADGTWEADTGVPVPVADKTVPLLLRLESDADGTQRGYINGDMVRTRPASALITGSFVGMGLEAGAGPSPRILQVSAGGPAARRASWVAGWRQGATSNIVGFDDVNFGDEDNQSTQCALVLEPADPSQGIRLLGYGLRAAASGTTAAGTFSLTNPPRPGALVVVFVGVTASTDVTGALAVTGADFTRGLDRPKSGSSWGQGAVFAAVAPIDLNESSWNVVVTYPTVESVSVVAYEVTVQDDTAPIGAVIANTLGTHTAGSVNGASTISLPSADAAATVLAFLHVSAEAFAGSGASPGSGWDQGLVYAPTSQRGYLQTMTRPSGSTSTAVSWADVQTGTAATFSGVQLAVELLPYDGLPTTPGGSGVTLGGATDPWNGIITSAGAYLPDGTPIWEFPGVF